MAERRELEALFLANLGTIGRIVTSVSRRHALSAEDAADFSSWVNLKLVEQDYAPLAKFRGESSLSTYLAVVIAMLFRDWRVQHWGRWRPSAAALRHGRLAVRLETLVYRDGFPLGQAGDLLRTTGETTLSDRELATLLTHLPMRSRRRPIEVATAASADAPSPIEADELVSSEESVRQRMAAKAAITTALRHLPVEESLMVRMRFLEGLSVADIARALQLEQKPLYRRLERALSRMRSQLETVGVSREQVRELLDEWVA
ncbi:MAG TPA: sigma-70 family RNA polymerase sigma factor [Gemmatimonadaceae bacterium]|nr:sigma-70 family RNA polymerase sigma factor [Gemmatimonadaceae bacterium]